MWSMKNYGNPCMPFCYKHSKNVVFWIKQMSIRYYVKTLYRYFSYLLYIEYPYSVNYLWELYVIYDYDSGPKDKIM